MAPAELEDPLTEAVEFWSLLVEGVAELLLPPFIELEDVSLFALLVFALLLELLLLREALLFDVSLALALPLIAPEADPEALAL